MKSICFNLFDSHSVFFPASKFLYGGAEVRGVTIAGALAEKGFKTTVIIKQHQHNIDTTVNGVQVLSHYYYSPKPLSVFKKIRLTAAYISHFKNKISKDNFYKWYPYIQVDADYYAAFEITDTTKNLVEFCQSFNKKFLLFIASDGELSFENEDAQAMGVRKSLAEQIIKIASQVFVQNNYQLEKLQSYFHREGIQVNNPLPLNMAGLSLNKANRLYITWIGKSSKAKQPLLFLELARQFPGESFYMIMNKSDEVLHDLVLKQMPANVIFKESRPFAEVNTVLNASKLFVNTSLYEGFPNTFLQAGYFAVPIVSLHVNPNQIIERSDGAVYGSGRMNTLKLKIDSLLHDTALYNKMSENIRAYILAHHSVESVTEKITNCI